MNVAIIYGGKSCEHNISVITGVQAMKSLDAVKHNLVPIYIDNDGKWWTGKGLEDISTYKNLNFKKLKNVHLEPASKNLYSNKGKVLEKIDVAILANHGLNGEDGTLQGLLQISNIPYSGSSVRGSAVGMDKIVMKQVFEIHGLNVVPYTYFTSFEYQENSNKVIEKIISELEFPLIIKPSNLGSSIGITLANNKEELISSIDVACKWDNRILVEKALTGFKELNCAVLGYGEDLRASEIEEPIGWEGFLTFEDKYVKSSKGGGRNFPAKINKKLYTKVQESAKQAFSAIGASGVARIDFMLEKENLFVNEINSIPGALSNYLFSYGDDGISFSKLLDTLIDIALIEQKHRDNLTYSYNSAFELSSMGGKGSKGKV